MFEFDPLVFQVASISKLFWLEYLNNFVDAEAMVEEGESKIIAFPSFTLEVFHRLYYEPEPELLAPMPPESEWALCLHQEFLELIGFDGLVLRCQGNQLAAGLATEEYCRTVIEQLPYPRPQWINPPSLRNAYKQLKLESTATPTEVFEDLLNTPERMLLSKQQRELQTRLDDLIVEAGDDSQSMLHLLQRDGKEAVKLAQKYATSLDATQIRQMLRAAIASAVEKLEQAQAWLEMMGLSWGNEDSLGTQVSTSEKLALFQKIANNDKIKQIALLAGRLKDIADRKRRSLALDSFGEITTIELGDNLSRLLPSELQKLSDPALFPLFAKGYYDRSLLQYKTRGKEKQCRGPIVVCLDSSSSMKGLPDTWAKAVTAVLGQIANSQNRHFRVIHFATKVCRIDDFPQEQHDYQRLLESMLSFYAGGGTRWEPALKSAFECIEQQHHFKQADIVMVTDGECDVEWKFLNDLRIKKQQLEFTVYGVLLGQRSERQLKKFCERVWVVKDLVNEDVTIEELFLL